MKTAFYLSIEPFWGKRFLWKNFGLSIIFGLRTNFFQLFVKIFSSGFQSCILCFHQNVSKKKNLFPKKIVSFLNTFGLPVNNFWPSAMKHSLGLSKLDSECPKDVSETKKKLFLKIIQVAKHAHTLNEKNSTFREKNRWGCRNCFLCFHRNIARKNNFPKRTRSFFESLGN